MKKILIFLLILFILAVATAAVFVATFDVNRYKPFIIQKIEEKTGMPVGIGRLSLSWGGGGIGIQARDLAVYTSADRKSKSVKVGEAFVQMKLLSLLKKDIQISSVVVTKPVVVLEKTREGHVRLLGAKPRPAEPQPSKASGGAPAPPLSVKSIRVVDGEVHFYDDAAKPPLHLTVRDVDAQARDVSLSKVFPFSVRAAIFSREQNITASGRSPQDVSVDTDLRQLDLAELSEAFPDLQKFQFDDQPAGKLHVETGTQRVRLEGGRFAFQLKPNPAVRSPQLGGHVSLEIDADAQGLTADAIKRSVSGHGRIRLKDGVILNFNLLREVFQKISLLPGMDQALGGGLAAPYTALGPMDLSFKINQGIMDFGNLFVTTDLFTVQGPCQIGLDGSIRAKFILRVSPKASSILTQSVAQTQSLLNARGELEIPVELSGKFPQVVATPDLNYLTSRLVGSFLS